MAGPGQPGAAAPHPLRRFVRAAGRRTTVGRALGVATVITPCLMAVNHWDAILAGALDRVFLLQTALTFLVPYAVSTYSSARAEMAEQMRGEGHRRG